jgi:hypothetical protein
MNETRFALYSYAYRQQINAEIGDQQIGNNLRIPVGGNVLFQSQASNQTLFHLSSHIAGQRQGFLVIYFNLIGRSRVVVLHSQ